jgi:hypothetical protein
MQQNFQNLALSFTRAGPPNSIFLFVIINKKRKTEIELSKIDKTALYIAI